MNKKQLLSIKEQQKVIPAFDEHLLFALERRYFDFLDIARLELAMNPAEEQYNYKTDLRLVKIDEISYKGGADAGLHLLNMQNVLASLKDPSHSVVNVVVGNGKNTSIYTGLSKIVGKDGTASTEQYSKILKQTMHGNFLGVKATLLNADRTFQEVLKPMTEQREITAFPGIPSLRTKDLSGPFSQGIDRFIEGMRNEKYVLCTIAEPVSLPNVDGMIGNLFEFATNVHSSVKATIQKTKGSSDTLNIGMFGMQGMSNAQTQGQAFTNTESQSDSATTTGAAGAIGPGLAVVGGIVGTFICPGLGTIIGAGIGSAVGSIAGPLTSYLGGAAMANTATNTVASSFTRSVANTAGRMLGGGGFGGYARTFNRSTAISQEVLNKKAEYCENLCNQYIKRLQDGKNLGFWNVGVYLIAENKYTQLRGNGLLSSVLSGDETHWEPVRGVKLNSEALGQYLINFKNPRYNLLLHGQERSEMDEAVTIGGKIAAYCKKIGKTTDDFFKNFNKAKPEEQLKFLEELRKSKEKISEEDFNKAWEILEKSNLGHPLGDIMGGVSTPMNTEELSIMMNVPREEIQGITIREAAQFGVNYNDDEGEDKTVSIGKIIHKRDVLKDKPFKIKREMLKKHGFICGVTGSGKTNTCMNLLQQLDVPFMIIEPAKSEYRQLLNAKKDLLVFTLGNETISPFRLNPFEFIHGIDVLTHIDYLKTVFSAAFPMYASMPYLLEEAIVEIYLDYGWDLASSTNKYFDIETTEDFSDYFPTLQDLYNKIDVVVKEKKYAQQLSMDLSAALKARLSSLLTGSKGLMLNTKKSTSIKTLLENNVVLELKYIGDDDEKAFLMGMIFTMIYEYREANNKNDSSLKHLTLIEEAHRLLKNVPDYVSQEVGNARGKAVETFANVLSEVREYGEGILIADQIPAKLTPDVLKNTSLKIVHRTLAKDDRDFVGDTMSLSEEQKKEMPLLRVGQAIVHREDLDKAFLIQVDPAKEKLNKFIDNKILSKSMSKFHKKNTEIYEKIKGISLLKNANNALTKIDFRRLILECENSFDAFLMTAIDAKASEMKISFKLMNSILKEYYKIEDKTLLWCHYCNSTKRFIEELREKHPNSLDKTIDLHNEIINLLHSLILEQKNIDEKIKKYKMSFAEVVAFNNIYEYFAEKFVNYDEVYKNLSKDFVKSDFQKIIKDTFEFLTIKISELTFNAKFDNDILKLMHVAFLNYVLIANPKKEKIIKEYLTFFNQINK